MPRIVNVDLSSTVNGWREKTNLLGTYIGDLDALTTLDSSSIVGAINSIETKTSVGGSTLQLAKNQLSATTSGGGTYCELSYSSATGVFTFVRRALTQSDIPALDAGKITTGTFNPALLPNFDASNITTGTIDTARLPYLNANQTTMGQFHEDRIPSLATSKITSGIFLIDRIPNIPSSMITDDGTDIPADIIPAVFERSNVSANVTASRTMTNTNTFTNTGTVIFNGPVSLNDSMEINADMTIQSANDNQYDIGATGARLKGVYANTFYGLATSANFADLAEKYTTDIEYPVGTVMKVSVIDEAETDECNVFGLPVGVISLKPAFLMNADVEGQALALKGRVPVRVIGAVSKGETVYAHNNGRASKEYDGAAIVGVALETNTSIDEKLVECVLKL